MRAVLLTGIFALACGGRTLAGDPSFEEETGGSGGASAHAGSGAGPSMGGGAGPMPGGAGKGAGTSGPNPGKGGSPGTGAAPGKGGSPGAAGRGFAGSGASGGVSGSPSGGAPTGGVGGAPNPVECKTFCYEISNLCDTPIPLGTCINDCIESVFSAGASCVNENVQAMRCATRAIEGLPPDACLDVADVLLKFCVLEVIALQGCEQTQPTPGPACSESVSSTVDSCTVVRQCETGTISVFECAGPTGSATCGCWTDEGQSFSVTTNLPAEKACYDSMLTAPCQPLDIF